MLTLASTAVLGTGEARKLGGVLAGRRLLPPCGWDSNTCAQSALTASASPRGFWGARWAPTIVRGFIGWRG
jgi:hypothetical protein